MTVIDNTDERIALASLTSAIVSAYVSKNVTPRSELPKLISVVHAAVKGARYTAKEVDKQEETRSPAVPIKRSVQQDHITCLDCGETFKSLKRHLTRQHGLLADEYRARWGLPHDYPMVAPNYAEVRSQLAKEIGLGQARWAADMPNVAGS